jgi:hypothetical protein
VRRNIISDGLRAYLRDPEYDVAMLAILACVSGIYLGLNFRVLILLPLSLLGAGSFLFACWPSGSSFSESFKDTLLPLLFLQAGYMLGLTARGAYIHLAERVKLVQSKRV